MSRYLLSLCVAGGAVLLSAGRALAQCTLECRAVPEPVVEFYRLWLPAVSSWPPLAPVCTSDACGAAGLGLVAPALGLGLSSTAAGWIAAAVLAALLLLCVYLYFGAYALAGLLRALALCGLAAAVVLGFNAWYDAAPAMVIGVLIGFTGGVVSTGAAALILFSISGGGN